MAVKHGNTGKYRSTLMNDWKHLFRTHILERGWNYHGCRGNHIPWIKQKADTGLLLRGSEDYEVQIIVQMGRLPRTAVNFPKYIFS